MIPARPTRLGRLFWTQFSLASIDWSFQACEWATPHAIDPNRSMLFIGNHISWWDGFWPIYLNHRHWKKDFYVMMLETELRKRPFMAQGGAFSIQPASRSVMDSLAYASRLLRHPRNLVVIYPQGEIRSQHDRHWSFSPGVNRILSQTGALTQVVFSAAFTDYLNQPKPRLRFYTEQVSFQGDVQKGVLNAAYAGFFDRNLETHLAWVRQHIHQA